MCTMFKAAKQSKREKQNPQKPKTQNIHTNKPNQTKPNQIKQPEEKRQKNLTQFQNVGSNFPSPRLCVCLSFVPIATHEVKQNNTQLSQQQKLPGHDHQHPN